MVNNTGHSERRNENGTATNNGMATKNGTANENGTAK